MREILVLYLNRIGAFGLVFVCMCLSFGCDGGTASFASSNASLVSSALSSAASVQSRSASILSSSAGISLFGSSTFSASSSSSSSRSLNVSSSNISSVGNSSSSTIVLSGIISYDYVPHNSNNLGLNYSAIVSRPVRGARLELIDELGQIKAVATTANDGGYAINVQKNLVLKVRVKAQLLSGTSPMWDFKVTDNTANNALYVLDGGLLSTGAQNSTRNLHASAGWRTGEYSTLRAAAPFAILDSIYSGLTRILAVGNKRDLKPLELRWSTKNSVADGDISKGEIGTSFYDGSAIYILGDANHDTDEYDAHVLLHEWGHYLDNELFRSDSIGGEHSSGDFLDFRVAMSEGFANAFACMMLDNNNYSDSSGSAQSSGFVFNVAKKDRTHKGYFNEGSIASVFYNYYSSSLNKTAKDFSPVFNVMSDPAYYSSEAFTSIYLFRSQLKIQQPEHDVLFSTLMQEQEIYGTDEYAKDESNNGGLAINLPIYKSLSVNGLAVNVCSASDFGKYNKLGNSQFLTLNIAQAGNYTLRMNKTSRADVSSKPEFILYQKGRAIVYANNTVSDSVIGQVNVTKGSYVLEAYDYNNSDIENTDNNITCFDLQITAN